jgi:hypothetical protein
MDMEELRKLMADLMAAHRETQPHVVSMLGRQADLEALTKQVVENNNRLGRILEIHDYDIDELDARLKRLEDRHRGENLQ